MKFINNIRTLYGNNQKTSFSALKSMTEIANLRKNGLMKSIFEGFHMKLLKSFEFWRFENKEAKNMRKTQELLRFFSLLNSEIMKNSLSEVFQRNNQEKMKNRLIKKFLLNNQMKKQEAFCFWLEKSRSFIINSKFHDKTLKQTKALFVIENKAKSLKTRLLGEILRKFEKIALKHRILKKILEKHRKKALQRGFSKLETLVLGESRNIEKTHALSKSESLKSKLNFIIKRVFSESFSELKQHFLISSMKKAKILEKLVHNLNENQRKNLAFWRSLNILEKSNKLHRKTLLLYSNLNEIFSNSLEFLLSNDNSLISRKKAAISKIYSNFKEKLRDSLNSWRNQELFNRNHKEKAKKAYKISQMTNFTMKFENLELKRLLEKFFLNRSKAKVLIKLKEKLQFSFSNQIYQSFLEWKKIPEKRVSEYEKPSNLMKTLRIFKKIVYFDLRKTMQIFNKTRILGKSLKEQARKRVFSEFAEKKHDFFNNWKENTRKSRILGQATSIIGFFESGNELFADNFRLLIGEALIKDRRKEAILKNLLGNFKRNLRENFLIWLGNAQISKVEGLALLEKEAFLINSIENQLKRLEKKDLKWVVRKFKRNRDFSLETHKLYDLLRKFVDIKILFSFKQWKNIEKSPISKEKGEKLQRNIEKITRNWLKDKSLDKLKVESLEGINRKTHIMQVFIDNKKDLRISSFFHWRQIQRNYRNNFLIKNMLLFFENANSVFIENFAILFKGLTQEKMTIISLKKKLIFKGKRLESLYFNRWRGIIEENMKKNGVFEIKAGFLIKRLENSIRENENRDKKRVFEKFFANIGKMKKIKAFYEILQHKIRTLLREGIDNIMNDIEKMKKSPNIRLLEFLLKKSLIVRKDLFQRLKRQGDLGNFVKEKGLLSIFLRNMDSFLGSFRKWRFENKRAISEEKTREITRFFETLSGNIEKSLEDLLISRNLKNSMTFIHKIMRFMNKRLENSLENLLTQPKINSQNTKNEILMNFINKKRDLMRDFFLHWKNTQKAMKSLANIKKLLAFCSEIDKKPSQKLTILRKFRRNHEKLLEYKPKVSFFLYSLEHFLRKLKSQAFFKLFSLKSSKNSKTSKTSKTLPLITLMTQLDFSRKRDFFSRFRKLTKNLDSRLKSLSNGLFLISNLRKNLLFEGFEKIRHHAEIHIVKTYLNSLWKWKLSNMDSRYYIQMMRKIKKTAAFAQIFVSFEHLQRNLKRVPFKNHEKDSKILKKVFSCLILRLFSRKELCFYQWRIKALEITKNTLILKNSRFFLGNKVISLLKAKKNKEISSFFKKWMLEKNKAKFSQRVFTKNYRNLMKSAFYRWKLRVFSMKDRFKAMQMYLALEKHEKNEKKLGFLIFKQNLNRLSKGNSLFNLIFLVSSKFIKKRVFDKIKKSCQISNILQLERLKKFMPLLINHRKNLLNQAFSLWKSEEIKRKLTKLTEIFKNHSKFQLKTGFDFLMNSGLAEKIHSKLKGLIKLLLFGSNIEKFRLSNAFSIWRNSDSNKKNPWFFRAIGILAKDSMLNPQIAYWRMRDYKRIAKLRAPQIVKLKKMVNNLTKAYETVMSFAFWRIENRRIKTEHHRNHSSISGGNLIKVKEIFRFKLLENSIENTSESFRRGLEEI